MTTQTFDYGFTDELDLVDDAAIDRWNDGVLDALRGKARASDDKDYTEGYEHGLEEAKVVVVMPDRPEGYYHMPLEQF